MVGVACRGVYALIRMIRKDKDMFCTKCGAQIADGSKFCDKCGAKFEDAAPAAASAPAAAVTNAVEAAKEKAAGMDKKTLLTIAVAAVAAIVLVIILCVALTGGPKKTVKAYLKATDALSEEVTDLTNKYSIYGEKAQAKLDLDDDDDDDDDSSWKITDCKKYGKKDDMTEGIKEYIGSAMKGDDDAVKGSAVVEVTKTDDDDNETKVYYTVVKIGGSWYILDSTSSAENMKDVANEWEAYAD